ncbi:MAPEG family protein [Sphingomonas sp. PP-F2F-G114-C0414]|uniref:MAPEG family protein n=1 Tax=Sphingomonas sp. PP-F2F-G114-C0414 TaxID=2135662 RepID=UPI000EF8FB0B|nr:MAPEG family protein [Sphingomonas sp. PP-F2F-G114-C0414]RMB36210.1 MAPEG family protein [Sphingomonas sp. PP-F2F-G114-C0414]
MHSEILRPMVVLIAWTLVMLGWTLATRLPAMKAAGVDMRTLVGTKAADADRALPPHIQWKAHNHNHLMEQPTLFYAVCAVLALSGTGNGINAWIAWAYVGLRIVHSIVQSTSNRVRARFVFFMLSSLMLIALTLHAALAVF